MKRFIFAIPLLLLLAMPSFAQVNTFALTASPITLPNNKTTLVGTIAGVSLTVTNNFDLRQDNILVPAGDFAGYFGGFNYRLPVFSTKLNNISPTLSGERFQFYITASAGTGTTPSGNHVSFLAGGGVNYDLTGSGRWTMGVEVRYAKLPGYANNTAIVSLGPSLHF